MEKSKRKHEMPKFQHFETSLKSLCNISVTFCVRCTNECIGSRISFVKMLTNPLTVLY